VILQALYELAGRENLMADPDYEPKPVAWLVHVGPGGKFLGIVGTHTTPPAEGKKKPVPKRFPVPREPGPARTVADKPLFLHDNAMYVFGLDVEGKFTGDKAERVAKRFGLFRERARKCAEKTGDEGVEAVHRFLESVAAGREKITLPEECASNDLFAFVYEPDLDILVTNRKKVRTYWCSLRRKAAAGENASHRCLVSGVPCKASDSFPGVKKVPGGSTSGVFLVSFNSRAFESYGWNGNENAPISAAAAEACAEALRRLVDPAFPDPNAEGQTLPRRSLTLSADTVVCYWSAKGGEDDFASYFGGLVEANPDEVKEAYRSIWRGRPARLEDPTAFYALTLTGTQGRAVVRDWFESTVVEVQRNLAEHFGDIDIERLTPPPKGRTHAPNFPLPLLLEALA
jgi:CRISPR-associated protein Csd1